ncbi:MULTISPECIES: MarR family transcriptional regulator [unclassified Paludibacterium]|uniref:MarR family transcriptional regulator n=1 Tax=unclassified Paludibacterium TaxID=2618429 RepID=UPI001C055E29|nr:MarR family transcriptional regulator [Paludibacterium sp. B53371]BEV73127.1 transcriptional repressor MprA [Paludibacterium sp. THUN1379]
MKSSFQQVEQAIDAVGQRLPGASSRQEVLLNRLFCHVTARLSGHLNEALRPYGINDTIWIALIALYSRPSQMLYPSEISDALDFSRTNATRVSDEMVRHGWVEREVCAEDRRKVRLKLTAAGEQFVESMIPVTRHHMQSQWQDFSQDEKDQLETLMRKLLSSLGG